jgi:hypothetical protein
MSPNVNSFSYSWACRQENVCFTFKRRQQPAQAGGDLCDPMEVEV